MTDLNRLADLLLPGIRNAQLKLEEVSNYLGAMPDSLRQYNGWQLIETAPKNYTVILVFWSGQVEMARWNEEANQWQEHYCGDFAIGENEVTHWMPLPEPPK